MNNKLHFEILINAPVSRVWDVMLGEETYKQWTVPFEPTSYFEGSWGKGDAIKFLSEGGDGMYSEIAENIPHKFISIKHLGIIKNGIKDHESEEAKKWGSAFENYTFTDDGGKTQLNVDIDMPFTPETKEVKEMFEDMWPKALQKLKELCETDK